MGKRLNADTAEIWLRKARDGKLYYRVGEVLQVREMPGTSILLLDYDSPTGRTLKKPSVRSIRERLNIAGVQLVQTNFRRSPSHRGWHCVAYVRGRWNKYQRIALQAILESDPEHCALAFKRAQVYTEKEFQEKGCVLFTNRKG